MIKIKAAVLPAYKEKFELSTISLDTDLRPEDILVKVVATGICHTDLVVRDEQLPFGLPAILGHEGAGIVDRLIKFYNWRKSTRLLKILKEE